jgi:hypothetical protein
MEQQGIWKNIRQFLKSNPFFVSISLFLPVGIGLGVSMMLPSTFHNGVCIVILTITTVIALVISEIIWYKRKVLFPLELNGKIILGLGALIIVTIFISVITQLDFQDRKIKQSLLKSKGEVDIAIETDSNWSGMKFPAFISITLVREGNSILDMNGAGVCSKNKNSNQEIYHSESLTSSPENRFNNKPISYFVGATDAIIKIYNLHNKKYKIVSGTVIFTFNDSVQYNISVQPQIVTNNTITIKNFSKNIKRIN